MSSAPMRVVIDTSVFIRYLIRPGAAIQRLIEEMWLEDQISVVLAPELLAELEGVLSRNFIQLYIQPEDGEALLEVLRMKAEWLPTLGEIPAYTRDPKDDKFVACAIAAQAPFLISEDRDLLALGEIEGVRIVTPYMFVITR